MAHMGIGGFSMNPWGPFEKLAWKLGGCSSQLTGSKL